MYYEDGDEDQANGDEPCEGGDGRKAGAPNYAGPLNVSAPFHSSLMAPAAEKFAAELARVQFSDPAPPVVTNVEATPNGDGSRIAELLRRQIAEPVRFVQMIEQLRASGVTRLLEIGPGRVLTGLAGRIDRALSREGLSSLEELPGAAQFALETET